MVLLDLESSYSFAHFSFQLSFYSFQLSTTVFSFSFFCSFKLVLILACCSCSLRSAYSLISSRLILSSTIFSSHSALSVLSSFFFFFFNTNLSKNGHYVIYQHIKTWSRESTPTTLSTHLSLAHRIICSSNLHFFSDPPVSPFACLSSCLGCPSILHSVFSLYRKETYRQFGRNDVVMFFFRVTLQKKFR